MSGPSAYRDLKDVFAARDEITQAVVAAIEPQLYAAESFRSQRKTPDSMDAWDSGDARVAALRARDAAGQSRGAGAAGKKPLRLIWATPSAQPAGGLPHLRGPYGWQEMATAVPVASASRAAAIRADSEDAWAHYARPASICSPGGLRHFGSPNSSWRCGSTRISAARGLYGVAPAYRGLWEAGDAAAREASRLSPRDPFAAIYCGVAGYCQYAGPQRDQAIHFSREALRQRSDFVGAHRVLTACLHVRPKGAAKVALAALLRAQPNFSLASSTQMPFEAQDGQGALSGGV